MKKFVLALVAFLALAGCIADLPPVLAISVHTPPPDSTTQQAVTIAGQVVRSPPSATASFTVTVEGGAATVEEPANSFGVFTLEVTLNRFQVNQLTLRARDNTGAVSSALQFTVVHVEDVPVAPPARGTSAGLP